MADNAARRQRFTVEGDPADVFAFGERLGLQIVRPRWWQRTYAVPRWIVWTWVPLAILGLPRSIEWWSHVL